MKNKNDLRKYLGEEKYNRVMEAMNALGLAFPERFYVYEKTMRNGGGIKNCIGNKGLDTFNARNYVVLFHDPTMVHVSEKQEDIDKDGYLEFNPQYQSISFTKDGIFYDWSFYGSTGEEFTVRNGSRENMEESLEAVFRPSDRGIVSSTMTVTGKYDFPKMTSYIDSVTINDDTANYHVTSRIEDYNTLFRDMITSGRFSYMIPESLNKPEVLSRIAKVYEETIDRLVGDLTLSDQSYRFELEKDTVAREYNIATQSAEEEKEKAYDKAEELYIAKVERAETVKDIRMNEINNMQSRYNDQLKLTQGGNKNE